MHKKMTRRDFLKKGARAAVGVVALTACGNVASQESGTTNKIDEITVGDDDFIIALEKLKDLGAVNFVYRGKRSILLYNEGDIKAFENICTHKGGPSKLSGNKLVCQWHGAQFDPVTGRATKGPAPTGSRLPAINLADLNGKIYVQGNI